MSIEHTKTYHIIFDAIDVEKKFLNDERFVLDLLLEIPPLIGMKILSGPNLVRDYEKSHEGISGFAIIDFSHISIHTFVKTKEAFIDIFSCKQFDYQKTRSYLYKKLNLKHSQVETVEVRYPRER